MVWRARLALVDQPVGEERLEGRGERRHPASPKAASNRSAASSEQLGRGLQVPISGAGIDVAEIGRQCRHARCDVPAVAIPTQAGGDAEGVAEVVNPGPAWCRGADAALVEQAGEGGLERRMAEARPGAGDEQRRRSVGRGRARHADRP